MKKHTWAFTAVIFAVIFFAGNCLAADVAKIGILDPQSVLQKSSAGKAAQAQIREVFSTKERELKKRGSEIQELEKQLKREAMVMSQEKRDDKSRELKIKRVELDDLSKKYTRELKQLEKKLLGRIQKDIESLTNEIGKKEGYLLIVSKPAVLYNPTSIDVTDQLIQQYNAKFAKGETKASKKE
ncbi:MAG: OmpH family outer membrane protein [Pseudomonadota bacterium]